MESPPAERAPGAPVRELAASRSPLRKLTLRSRECFSPPYTTRSATFSSVARCRRLGTPSTESAAAMAATSIPSHAGPPSKSVGAPSATLYLRNLNDKLRKVDLQKELYCLFTTYGRVLDVNVMPGPKMRGQAHVVFPNAQASTQAMRELQGFNFHGRDIKIEYGKSRSHIFNKLEGEYKTREEEKQEQLGTAPQSVFEAPRPGQPVAAGTKTSALPAKPANGGGQQGLKRPREEEDENEEAPMDEDEDDDVEMEQSDED